MSIQKISYIIILSLGLLPIASCQKKEVMPEFHVQISHPDNKYQVTPVKDYILTLEGTPAGLPYGSSSGRWADSGARWTNLKHQQLKLFNQKLTTNDGCH